MRWSNIIRTLGYRSAVLEAWAEHSCDALIALHAVKSRPSVVSYHTAFPGRPLAVALTGTDIYGESGTVRETHETLRLATTIVALTPAMADRLTRDERLRSVVIVQSAVAPKGVTFRNSRHFDVCVVGHLRAVKDPLLASKAVRRLPESSRVRVTLYGAALEPHWAEMAKEEMFTNARFRWAGDRPHGETMRAIANARLLVLTSKAEGGPAVISEALACGTPILATRIEATVGLLGDGYPGLFPVGDDGALTNLMGRCEADRPFERQLKLWCRNLKPLVSPARERGAWGAVLSKWFPVG